MAHHMLPSSCIQSSTTMLIYRHHTASDVIDLDDATGRWVPVPEQNGEPLFVGAAGIALRFDEPIRGSYTIENDKRCCLYWNDAAELVFRTPDERRLPLFRRDPDGRLHDLMPRLCVDLQPALDADGNTISGISVFTLRDGERELLTIAYDAMRYMEAYAMCSFISFVPDDELGAWDFFVGFKDAVDAMKQAAQG